MGSGVRRLLVRGPNWIGDAVMSEPALAELRRLFPKAEISLLVKPHIAALFSGHPAVDRLVVYEDLARHAGIIGKWVLASSLRRAGFDLAVLFQNAFEAALLAFLAGIPRRYGYGTDGRSLLLTDPIPRPNSQCLLRHKIHQVDYYFELLRQLGSGRRLGAPKLYVSSGEEEQAQQVLHMQGVETSDLVIGVNPGSTYGGAKRWLPERFAETADRLLDRVRNLSSRVHIVIVGGKGEERLGHEIAERMRVKPIVLSGQTTIRELMGIIKRCALFLTNDTGPMHIAAAFEVPTVGMFGPTDDQETGPVGELKTLVRHQVECSPCFLRECPIDHRCMTRITVEEVVEAAISQLQVGKFESSKYPDPNFKTLGLSNLKTPLSGVTVFLDRDGTLNVERGYVTVPEQLELHAGAAQAIARLNQVGARVVLITNQSAIGRGLVTVGALEAIHAQLHVLLSAAGAKLDGVYVCPHHPDDHCECRKPATGLVKRAVADLGLDLTISYMVGDQKRDVDLARAIGARSVLVLTGPTSLEGLNAIKAEGYGPDHVARTLPEAVNWILEAVKARSTTNV
jgi:heptosyltransferase-2